MCLCPKAAFNITLRKISNKGSRCCCFLLFGDGGCDESKRFLMTAVQHQLLLLLPTRFQSNSPRAEAKHSFIFVFLFYVFYFFSSPSTTTATTTTTAIVTHPIICVVVRGAVAVVAQPQQKPPGKYALMLMCLS